MRVVGANLLAVVLCGCSVVHVSEKSGTGEAQEIDGIPFYVKVEQFKKTSVYAQTWLRATLTVEKKAIDIKEGKEVVVDAGKQPFVRDIPKESIALLSPIKLKILDAETQSPGTAAQIVKEFEALKSHDPRSTKAELVANGVMSEWVVDRSRTYYLNAPLPWFGNASLTQKLAADGTLTEASSSSDTKLAEGLSTLIPFKEFLSGEFVETPKEAAANVASDAEKMEIGKALMSFDTPTTRKSVAESERDRRIVYAITLSVEEVGYEYTLTSLPQAGPITDLTAIDFAGVSAGTTQFTRKEIAAKSKVEKKEEGQTVGITGSVEFPKGWGTQAKPQ